jgi:hypothetical protein
MTAGSIPLPLPIGIGTLSRIFIAFIWPLRSRSCQDGRYNDGTRTIN